MSITTFSELKTAVNGADGFAHRQYSDTKLEEFIALAESRLNAKLRVRQMETIIPSGTIASYLVTRPTDCVEVKALWSDTRGFPPVEQKSLEFVLKNGSESSIPQFYAWDRTYWRFNTTAGTVAGTYYAAIPALTSLNTTNWLLTARPDIYLACVVAEAADFSKDPDAITKIAKAEGLIAEYNIQDQRSRFSGNSLVVRIA